MDQEFCGRALKSESVSCILTLNDFLEIFMQRLRPTSTAAELYRYNCKYRVLMSVDHWVLGRRVEDDSGKLRTMLFSETELSSAEQLRIIPANRGPGSRV